MELHATVTPFTLATLAALSLGDSRAAGMVYGPWTISFHEDTIMLDGVPVALTSWEHARRLAAGRMDALRWLAIMQEDTSARASRGGVRG